MSLVRWDPFSEFEGFFNRPLPRAFGGWPRFSAEGNAGAALQWSPSADISETDKEYLIRAELPAVKKEDVKVTVEGGTIKIEGERKQRKEEKGEKSIRVESFYGTFARSFVLPEDVNVAAIKCDEKDGVLTVHLPKKAEAAKPKAKQIKVD